MLPCNGDESSFPLRQTSRNFCCTKNEGPAYSVVTSRHKILKTSRIALRTVPFVGTNDSLAPSVNRRIAGSESRLRTAQHPRDGRRPCPSSLPGPTMPSGISGDTHGQAARLRIGNSGLVGSFFSVCLCFCCCFCTLPSW